MSASRSTSGSWSRNSVLWVQVATMLHHGRVSSGTTENIRRELFQPRHLTSVGITAAADGRRVGQWNLRIDWKRHKVLLQTSRIVSKAHGFREDQVSYALGVFVELVEDHFAATPAHGRGWTFSSTLDFSEACRRIGVAPGRRLPDHPKLARHDGLVVPGLEEASIEVFGLG